MHNYRLQIIPPSSTSSPHSDINNQPPSAASMLIIMLINLERVTSPHSIEFIRLVNSTRSHFTASPTWQRWPQFISSTASDCHVATLYQIQSPDFRRPQPENHVVMCSWLNWLGFCFRYDNDFHLNVLFILSASDNDGWSIVIQSPEFVDPIANQNWIDFVSFFCVCLCVWTLNLKLAWAADVENITWRFGPLWLARAPLFRIIITDPFHIPHGSIKDPSIIWHYYQYWLLLISLPIMAIIIIPLPITLLILGIIAILLLIILLIQLSAW